MIIGTVIEHIRDFGNSEFERGKRWQLSELMCFNCMHDANCKIQQEMRRQGYPREKLGCLNPEERRKE